MYLAYFTFSPIECHTIVHCTFVLLIYFYESKEIAV